MRTNQRITSYTGALISVLFLALVVTACSSMPAQLAENLGEADSAVYQAKADNAAEYAPADLKKAENELKWAKANQQLSNDQFNRSKTSMFLAQKATIDAKVASAKVEYAELNHEVDALQKEVSQLYEKVE